MSRSPWRDPSVLIVPAMLFLVVGFLLPLVWFFVSALREIGSLADIASQFAMTLTSRAVLSALFTTNWIALIVTLACLLAGYPIAYYLARPIGCGLPSCCSASLYRTSRA